MKRKFVVLRFFSEIQIGIGAVLLLLACVAVWIFVSTKLANDLALSYEVAIIVALFLSGIASISYGQFLQVIMQIEENTRLSRENTVQLKATHV